MRKLKWAEYSKVLRENTLYQEEFESANDLFLSEYQGFFEEPSIGRINVSSVKGIGNYTIKSTKANLKDDVELEMNLDEPLFTVGFLFTGTFIFHYGDQEKGIKVVAPSVVVYRQNRALSYQYIDSSRPYETLNISFNDQVLQRILKKYEDSNQITERLQEEEMILLSPEDQFLGSFFDKLKLIPLDKDVHNLFLAESMVLKILNKAMLVLSNRSQAVLAAGEAAYNLNSSFRLYEVLTYIKDNLHKNISLTKIANRFEVSPRWLQRHFKEDLQTNFSDYLKDLRLQRAYDLLTSAETKVSIRDICLEVGYNSSQTFSSNFRKRYHVSPSQLISPDR